jgi:cell shape-determining protein MreC
MVGTIEEMLESESKDFNAAKIKFSTNFSTLRHVFVIENLHQTEIDSLMSNN